MSVSLVTCMATHHTHSSQVTLKWVTECVGFNVPLDTQQLILETSLSRQLTALLLTTKNNETKHHTHPEHNRQTEKILSCITEQTRPWFGSRNEAGPFLASPGARMGLLHQIWPDVFSICADRQTDRQTHEPSATNMRGMSRCLAATSNAVFRFSSGFSWKINNNGQNYYTSYTQGKLWNMTNAQHFSQSHHPSHGVHIPHTSLPSFKRQLKTFLFTKFFPSV